MVSTAEDFDRSIADVDKTVSNGPVRGLGEHARIHHCSSEKEGNLESCFGGGLALECEGVMRVVPRYPTVTARPDFEHTQPSGEGPDNRIGPEKTISNHQNRSTLPQSAMLLFSACKIGT